MYVSTSIPTNTNLISYVTTSLLMALPYPETATQAAVELSILCDYKDYRQVHVGSMGLVELNFRTTSTNPPPNQSLLTSASQIETE